jgi:hypothetical protein
MLAGILLLLLLGLVVWHAKVRTSDAAAVRRLEQEARRRGEPVTLAELATNYPAIPDEENAAGALIKLWSADEPEVWAAFAAGERNLPEGHLEDFDPALPYLGSDAHKVPRDRALSPESFEVADLFLVEKAAHLEAVRTALRRPRFHFSINFETGPAGLMPHLPRLKNEAVRFQVEALVAAEKGDVAEAIRAIEDITRTGQLLANEPTLISQLVRVVTLSLALESMEQLLSRQQLDTNQLGRLQSILDRSNLKGTARAALIYERPFSLAAFDPQVAAQLLSSPDPGDSTEDATDAASKVRQGFKLLQTIGYLSPDRKLMLETFQQAIGLAGEETPEALMRYEVLFDEANAKARKFPPKLFSGLMLPSVRKVAPRFAAYEARRRAALTILAIERFRLEHDGNCPEDLDALIPTYWPAVMEDPFDGEELRFKKLDRGFVVYSVGKDREDNDGNEHTRGSVEHTDITFTVQR